MHARSTRYLRRICSMSAERDLFSLAKRSIFDKTSCESVIEIFSFIRPSYFAPESLKFFIYPTPYGTRLPCRCGGKYARQNNRAATGADLGTGITLQRIRLVFAVPGLGNRLHEGLRYAWQ